MTVRLLSTREEEEGIDFKCGAAIAPVTDWKYYGIMTHTSEVVKVLNRFFTHIYLESVYSERYLGMPSENENGYIKSSLLEGAR